MLNRAITHPASKRVNFALFIVLSILSLIVRYQGPSEADSIARESTLHGVTWRLNDLGYSPTLVAFDTKQLPICFARLPPKFKYASLGNLLLVQKTHWTLDSVFYPHTLQLVLLELASDKNHYIVSERTRTKIVCGDILSVHLLNPNVILFWAHETLPYLRGDSRSVLHMVDYRDPFFEIDTVVTSCPSSFSYGFRNYFTGYQRINKLLKSDRVVISDTDFIVDSQGVVKELDETKYAGFLFGTDGEVNRVAKVSNFRFAPRHDEDEPEYANEWQLTVFDSVTLNKVASIEKAFPIDKSLEKQELGSDGREHGVFLSSNVCATFSPMEVVLWSGSQFENATQLTMPHSDVDYRIIQLNVVDSKSFVIIAESDRGHAWTLVTLAEDGQQVTSSSDAWQPLSELDIPLENKKLQWLLLLVSLWGCSGLVLAYQFGYFGRIAKRLRKKKAPDLHALEKLE